MPPVRVPALSLRRVKSPEGSLDAGFLGELVEVFQLDAFVETGTFMGNTTAVAARLFREVHTIELSLDLARQAAERFAGEAHIHIYRGDSSAVLPTILQQLRGPTLFWLDGHCGEGVTAGGRANRPILDELAAIARSGRKDAVILIDDLRLFDDRVLPLGESSSLHGYPSVNQLHAAVQAIDPAYQFFVLGDVALAFPGAANVTVSPLVMALTVSRLFDGANVPLDELIAAECLIPQARGVEREVLRELPAMFEATERHGRGLHYRLWYAQTLLGENKFIEASRQLLEILQLGFDHWRIKWYLAVAIHVAGDNRLACEILDELIAAVPAFGPAKALREALGNLPKPEPAASSTARPTLSPTSDARAQLNAAGLHRPGQPLRLHLGCGEQHLDGYVNIDYPPSEHSVQTRIGADIFGDITKLRFPPESVAEIRLHHVFEHFKRSEALALVIRWHEALQPGGRLHLETPDVRGCAEQLVADIPYRQKQAVTRHCFGSQEAAWANHYDGWSEERFQHVLGRFGFEVRTRAWRWPQPPHLANVEAIATKARAMNRAQLLAAADAVLEEYMVADVPCERAMCEVWRRALREFLVPSDQPVADAAPTPEVNWLARLHQTTVHPNSPGMDTVGFDDDSGIL